MSCFAFSLYLLAFSFRPLGACLKINQIGSIGPLSPVKLIFKGFISTQLSAIGLCFFAIGDYSCIKSNLETWMRCADSIEFNEPAMQKARKIKKEIYLALSLLARETLQTRLKRSPNKRPNLLMFHIQLNPRLLTLVADLRYVGGCYENV